MVNGLRFHVCYCRLVKVEEFKRRVGDVMQLHFNENRAKTTFHSCAQVLRQLLACIFSSFIEQEETLSCKCWWGRIPFHGNINFVEMLLTSAW